jgi:hypothetical protein
MARRKIIDAQQPVEYAFVRTAFAVTRLNNSSPTPISEYRIQGLSAKKFLSPCGERNSF